jgi:hypothetical protein
VPGATFTLRLVTDPPGSSPELQVWDNTHSKNPGYRAAIQLLDAVVRQLSQDTVPIGPAPPQVLVRDIRPLDVDEVEPG